MFLNYLSHGNFDLIGCTRKVQISEVIPVPVTHILQLMSNCEMIWNRAQLIL
jgi:hypothetical protein